MSEEVKPTATPTPPAPTEIKPDKKMLGPILIIFCAFILLVYILATSFGSKKHTLTNQPTEQNTYTGTTQTHAVQPLPQINVVSLTKNGFTPSKIQIHKGTAVRWTNDTGTDNASVNSDDYPLNQRWPELNLGKFDKGSAVAHIFTAAGTYTYHNQFNPKQKGTIVVE